jgi:hypothetical protein
LQVRSITELIESPRWHTRAFIPIELLVIGFLALTGIV